MKRMAAPGRQAAARAAESCNRACLTGIANQYLDAMAAQKPAGLPWAQTVRYSENSVPMAVGDGLWGAISARSRTGLMVADPKAGRAPGCARWSSTASRPSSPCA